MFPKNIFRAYDIRGVYKVDLTEEITEKIGLALASYIGEEKEIILGRDVRLSSEPLGKALINGLLSGGLKVIDIGVVTTPLLYFISAYLNKSGGIMITASHNPPEWNGFKIWTDKGFISMDMGMEKLVEIILKKKFKTISNIGHYEYFPNAIIEYENYLSRKIKPKSDIKIAADPGNGSCSYLIPQLFQKVGFEIISINNNPDGSFPSHPPEPNEETLNDLKKLIIDEKADFGVGFDGDGDRVVFIDDEGRIIQGNQILILLAEYYLKHFKGTPIVYEVSCSMGIDEVIRKYGGKPVISRVGHTYIYEKMRKEKAFFGGETSGHYYFQDMYFFDDAVFACLKLAEILSNKKEKLSEIIDNMRKYPRIPVKNYDCPDEKKFLVMKELSDEFQKLGYRIITLDGVKVINEKGWFLIRPSNTQPLIRLTVEAKNNKNLQKLNLLADRIIKRKIGKSNKN